MDLLLVILAQCLCLVISSVDNVQALSENELKIRLLNQDNKIEHQNTRFAELEKIIVEQQKLVVEQNVKICKQDDVIEKLKSCCNVRSGKSTFQKAEAEPVMPRSRVPRTTTESPTTTTEAPQRIEVVEVKTKKTSSGGLTLVNAKPKTTESTTTEAPQRIEVVEVKTKKTSSGGLTLVNAKTEVTQVKTKTTVLPRSCAEAGSKGINLDKPIEIDVDGKDGQLPALTVQCSATSTSGVYQTSMATANMTKVVLDAHEGKYSQIVKVTYAGHMGSIMKVVETSTSCKQYFRYDCHHAHLSGFVAWLTRNGHKAEYFVGDDTEYRGCACGVTGSCASSTKKCNCDSNDMKWRFDEGEITYKKHLPITGLLAGDTGDDKETARITVGPVVCLGGLEAPSTTVKTYVGQVLPGSCAEAVAKRMNITKPIDIDVDDSNGPLPVIRVQCAMYYETTIATKEMNNVELNNHEKRYSQKIQTAYTTSVNNVIEVVKQSQSATQYLRYDCFSAYLSGYVAWLTRHEERAHYFTGKQSYYFGCACGLSRTCANARKKCHCDSNDRKWRFDEGTITNKDDLPIMAIMAGDTGASYEKAKFTVGPLIATSKRWTSFDSRFGVEVIPLSCGDAVYRKLDISGLVEIDIDGASGPLKKFTVKCRFLVETEIKADNAVEFLMNHHEASYSERIAINYTANINSMIAVIDRSYSCKQFLRYNCYHAHISGEAAWVDRNNGQREYFIGDDPSYKGCSCGLTRSCSSKKELCNCNKNDKFWRADEGFITYKAHLPITAFLSGDTGDEEEKALVTVGSVICLVVSK